MTVNQWEDRRKKAILRDYYKERDRSQRQHPEQLVSLKSDDQTENNQYVFYSLHTFKVCSDKINVTKLIIYRSHMYRISAFHKAKQEFLRKKNEKKKSQEDALRVKSEREEALKKYKDKRMQTYKRLSKKTRKGQPVMKDRLEMLLEKIQRQV